MLKKILNYMAIGFSLVFIYIPISFACTTFGSIGNVNKQGGLLLVKNRDVADLGLEKLRLVKPKRGIEYLGLFYNTNIQDHDNYPYLAAGINRAGVVIVNNSIITVNDRTSLADESNVMKKIMISYHSVHSVLKDAKKLFSSSHPNHLLIADANELISVEIGENGIYRIREAKNGYLYHTNHFVNGFVMEKKNENTHVASTYERYALIGSLLKKPSSRPYTFDEFLQWVTEQKHGFANSLFRSTPHPTVATWIVSIPKNKKTGKTSAPMLYVRLTSPLQGYAVYHLTLNKDFWIHSKIIDVHYIKIL
jgi:hypothetical protein